VVLRKVIKNRLFAEIDFWLHLAYFRENRRKGGNLAIRDQALNAKLPCQQRATVATNRYRARTLKSHKFMPRYSYRSRFISIKCVTLSSIIARISSCWEGAKFGALTLKSRHYSINGIQILHST
jgi:hypothetical protein